MIEASHVSEFFFSTQSKSVSLFYSIVSGRGGGRKTDDLWGLLINYWRFVVEPSLRFLSRTKPDPYTGHRDTLLYGDLRFGVDSLKRVVIYPKALEYEESEDFLKWNQS